jgi:hypothetical protein
MFCSTGYNSFFLTIRNLCSYKGVIHPYHFPFDLNLIDSPFKKKKKKVLHMQSPPAASTPDVQELARSRSRSRGSSRGRGCGWSRGCPADSKIILPSLLLRRLPFHIPFSIKGTTSQA